jgi:type I restriction enzyme S subunit
MKQGWEIKKLLDVVCFQRGLTYSKKDEVDFSENMVLRSNNVDLKTNKLDFNEIRYINPKIVIPENKKVSKGSLIICTANGSKSHLGKVALIDDDYNYAFGGFMGLIKPKENLNSIFLFYLLTSAEYKKFIGAISDGANINNLKFGDLGEFQIPLPPIAEQQRIVTILDEAFTAIAKAKANAEQNLKNAKELFDSYLQGVFENGNWETKTIAEVCDEIFAGGDAPKNNFSLEKNDKYKIPIYANAVKNRGLYGYTDAARVSKPSITISARGSGTGHTEIRFDKYLPIVRLIVLIPNLSLINLEFLKHSIDNLDILRSGSAIPQLTVPMIKEYNLPLPSLEQQEIIVQKLTELKNETKKLESIYNQKINDLEELKKSVLQKAFSGKLKTDKLCV